MGTKPLWWLGKNSGFVASHGDKLKATGCSALFFFFVFEIVSILEAGFELS
jgi:hypothetical protein